MNSTIAMPQRPRPQERWAGRVLPDPQRRADGAQPEAGPSLLELVLLTLQHLLAVHPRPRGTLFALVEGIEPAPIPEAVMTRRRALCGNAMEAITGGADPGLLKTVLHDWDDTTCIRILRSIPSAMPLDAAGLRIDCVRLTTGAMAVLEVSRP